MGMRARFIESDVGYQVHSWVPAQPIVLPHRVLPLVVPIVVSVGIGDVEDIRPILREMLRSADAQ